MQTTAKLVSAVAPATVMHESLHFQYRCSRSLVKYLETIVTILRTITVRTASRVEQSALERSDPAQSDPAIASFQAAFVF